MGRTAREQVRAASGDLLLRLSNYFFLAVTLGEQESGQVGMRDPPPHRSSHQRLRVERDAETGSRQRRRVVGAVADGQRLRQWDMIFGRQPEQRLPLRF